MLFAFAVDDTQLLKSQMPAGMFVSDGSPASETKPPTRVQPPVATLVSVMEWLAPSAVRPSW